MLKIRKNWGNIANYPPNAQQRFAPLITSLLERFDFSVKSSCTKRAKFSFYFVKSSLDNVNLHVTGEGRQSEVKSLTSRVDRLWFVLQD